VAGHWNAGPRNSVCGRGDSRRSCALSELQRSGEGPSRNFDEETTTLIAAVLEGALEKLARDPVVLDVAEFMDAFEVLIVTSGRNDRQVRTIAEEVERVVDLRSGVKPLRVEGFDTGEWIALDYGFIIVHVFNDETRDYYDLEHLWSVATTYRPILQKTP
jgi:ribosome-associated protein